MGKKIFHSVNILNIPIKVSSKNLYYMLVSHWGKLVVSHLVDATHGSRFCVLKYDAPTIPNVVY
jgi:hypothetical protein